jgi:hypothetical protein
MNPTKHETPVPPAFRRLLAEVAQLRMVEPIARRLRSRFSSERVVTFPLGQLGRFGNQLFQIAATIGIARRNGCPFIFPTWPFARHFEFPIPQARAIRHFERRLPRTFGYEEIVIKRATELYGLFQSPRYFADCEDEVRHYFTPHHALLAMLERAFSDLLAAKTCSVHVRRTDYIDNPIFPEAAATDYYERAMAQFDSDTTFVIFSDDIEWCKERFRGRRAYFVEALGEAEDLFLMSRCGGHIIANSTFSWWAAWLDPKPHKKVIAPAQWFGGEIADPSVPFRYLRWYGRFGGYFDTSEIVPPGWIKV